MGKGRFVGTRVVRKRYLVKLTPVNYKRLGPNTLNVLVHVHDNPNTKPATSKATDLRAANSGNAAKIKGSYVYSIKTRKNTKAEIQKLKKLSGAQRKARRKRKSANLTKIVTNSNPANLTIGKRMT